MQLNIVENALKSVYLGVITELLNTRANPLLAQIKQSTSDVWGKEIRTCSFSGRGYFSAGTLEELGISEGKKYIRLVTELKNLYGSIAISDKAIRSAYIGGSFVDLLNAEIEELLSAAKFNVGRMLWGDGSGFLTSITGYDKGKYSCECRNLIEGMSVDVYDKNQRLHSSKILGIDRNSNEITLSLHPANDPVGLTLYTQNARDRELTGLGAIFSNSKTLYGANREENSVLNPCYIKIESKFNPIEIQGIIDSLYDITGSEINFIAVSADVKYAYQDYLASTNQNIDILELKGGYKALSFNGIPFVYDRFIEPGTMYLLNTNDFRLHQLCDWRYLENENGKILRPSVGKPSYETTLVKYCDLVCNRPSGQAKLTGIRASRI